jgi:hypothetical protein
MYFLHLISCRQKPCRLPKKNYESLKKGPPQVPLLSISFAPFFSAKDSPTFDLMHFAYWWTLIPGTDLKYDPATLLMKANSMTWSLKLEILMRGGRSNDIRVVSGHEWLWHIMQHYTYHRHLVYSRVILVRKFPALSLSLKWNRQVLSSICKLYLSRDLPQSCLSLNLEAKVGLAPAKTVTMAKTCHRLPGICQSFHQRWP